MKRRRQEDRRYPGPRGDGKNTQSSRHPPRRQREERRSDRRRERSPRPARERSRSRRDNSSGARRPCASGRQEGRAGAVAADARALNRRITSCSSAAAVLAAVEGAWQRGVTLNAVNVSTAIHRIGKFSKQRRAGEQYRLARDPIMLRSKCVCESCNDLSKGAT